MQVELKIDPRCAEPRIVVVAAEMTEEIDALLKKLSGQDMQMITGQKDGKLEILEPAELIRVLPRAARFSPPPGAGNMRFECGSTSWKSGWIRAALSASPIRRSLICARRRASI